jgi:2-amino-4-hydroxy-6-hydroxymethyldihydropteridine diphosphokinase
LNAARTRRDHPVALSLGSNLGLREEHILRAVARLGRISGFSLDSLSSLYESSPLGIATAHSFINAACTARTGLAPRELLAACAGIERDFGRLPSTTAVDRVIDIDILTYEDAVIGDAGLVVPHPRLAERLFVLIPLAEIAPDLVVPPSGKSIRELHADCRGEGWVRKVSSRGWIR